MHRIVYCILHILEHATNLDTVTSLFLWIKIFRCFIRVKMTDDPLSSRPPRIIQISDVASHFLKPTKQVDGVSWINAFKQTFFCADVWWLFILYTIVQKWCHLLYSLQSEKPYSIGIIKVSGFWEGTTSLIFRSNFYWKKKTRVACMRFQ